MSSRAPSRPRPARPTADTAGGAPPRRRPGAALGLDVLEAEGDWRFLGPVPARRIARQVAATLGTDDAPLPSRRCTATLVLSDNANVRALNRQWRGQDKPTNVLSFPSGAPARGGARHHLGDVILALETLAGEAADLGISPADHFRHLVLHGLLHLLGWDHETDAEAEEMEALETRLLAKLGVADPYAGTVPAHPTRSATRRAGRRS
jgi:probable rRNA maturation factor